MSAALAAKPGRWVAPALLVTPDGRYLMQHRDDIPRITLPDHWSCFGGAIDPGDADAEAAVRRELREELAFTAREARLFTEITVVLPFPEPRADRMSFFEVPITDADVAVMVLHEGQGMALFTPAALAAEAKVAPWDLCGVLMHARRQAMFGR